MLPASRGDGFVDAELCVVEFIGEVAAAPCFLDGGEMRGPDYFLQFRVGADLLGGKLSEVQHVPTVLRGGRAMVVAMTMLTVVLALMTGGYSDFCDGFEAGYTAGWCGDNAMCMEPMMPMCPMAPMGMDTFQGGYSVGFRRGMVERR